MVFGTQKDRSYMLIVFLCALVSAWGVYTYAESVINDSVVVLYPNSTSSKQSATVIVSNISTGTTIKSPVFIKGQARGLWFFEGSMGVKIVDDNEVVLGQGPVSAIDDWMTTKLVRFEGSIPFVAPTSEKGYIEFIKEDPRDGSEKISYKFPVSFGKIKSSGACEIGGCSGNICSETSGPGTCEWSDEYACYTQAICERQSSGVCGWTETPEFKTCINDVRKKQLETVI